MQLGGFVRTGGDIAGTAQRPGGEDGPPIARFPASLRARETIDRVAEKRYNNQPGGGRSGGGMGQLRYDPISSRRACRHALSVPSALVGGMALPIELPLLLCMREVT